MHKNFPPAQCASRYLEQKFVAPILSDSSLPWHFLDQGIGWEAQILEDVQKIYGALPENTAEEHYREKISLSDIARAGGVGKTSCCAIFRRFVNQTPNACLTDYRLRKGAELLMSTNLTVTEICYEVGFSGGSYFTETFHRCLGCSPGEYRKNSACTAG
ncbi:MAG: helix-turn-helix transcriptional regulator [Ruminococcus sp.]|uniref:helix-turn-helix transcriptional regulator n=1 Tax=Schaedlerella arabinosiphila TaxID=2044587 RepID=UPI0025581F94|nr:helix-turn-helix transcriptional regulator [Schaedlerella arabinosiphila]MCI9604201.1 helix-turn-helix transcriptional regulator [Ruminococcus sp.]